MKLNFKEYFYKSCYRGDYEAALLVQRNAVEFIIWKFDYGRWFWSYLWLIYLVL